MRPAQPCRHALPIRRLQDHFRPQVHPILDDDAQQVLSIQGGSDLIVNRLNLAEEEQKVTEKVKVKLALCGRRACALRCQRGR
jgi:hypothetical protein